MTQMALLNDDPIHRLMLLGYAEREAAFLCRAGLHSGFFLRRQYGQFIGARSGSGDHALVERLIRKGHAVAVAGCRKTMVYHLCARPFYAALAPGDNRNRRMRPPTSIKNRLMALDYVLDHPGHLYFATEQEKISYFTVTLAIEPAILPGKCFRSPGTEHSTTRVFADKYPIFVSDCATARPVVSFCFIDEGLATCSRFQAYLQQYRALFNRLSSFEVIYVAATRNLFWEAENLFEGFLRSPRSDDPTRLEERDLARLLDHFDDRERSENGLWDSFDRTKLIRLREERQAFSGAFFDMLYQSWQAGGKDALHASLRLKTSFAEPLNGTFSTHLLKHNYDVFGSAPEARNA